MPPPCAGLQSSGGDLHPVGTSLHLPKGWSLHSTFTSSSSMASHPLQVLSHFWTRGNREWSLAHPKLETCTPAEAAEQELQCPDITHNPAQKTPPIHRWELIPPAGHLSHPHLCFTIQLIHCSIKLKNKNVDTFARRDHNFSF